MWHEVETATAQLRLKIHLNSVDLHLAWWKVLPWYWSQPHEALSPAKAALAWKTRAHSRFKENDLTCYNQRIMPLSNPYSVLKASSKGAGVGCTRCWGAGRGQGERRRWKFRKSWLNSAHQQSLWDIHLSLAIMLAMEVPFLLCWDQWASGQQEDPEVWSTWNVATGSRAHQRQGWQLTGEANVTPPADSSDLSPSTSMGHPSEVVLIECKRWSPSQTKGTFSTTYEAFQEGGIHHKG